MHPERAAAAPAEADDEPDRIDAKIAGWKTILPDLDSDVEGIVTRIEVLYKCIKRMQTETLAEHGLKTEDWSVLLILRKDGEPYRVSAGELAQHAEISSGAMTNRLDRLEANGLVRRVPDPKDRRGVLVELTERGLEAWTTAAGVQGGKERLVTAALDDAERVELHRLLRRLTRSAPDGC